MLKFNKIALLLIVGFLFALSESDDNALANEHYFSKIDQNKNYLEIQNIDRNDHDSINAFPAWRWWERIGPVPYQGRLKYHIIIKEWSDGSKTCYDGYLSARNIAGGNFIYEGYLYICDQVRPIPTKGEGNDQ